jgi:Cu/Ag efflux pump CusA
MRHAKGIVVSLALLFVVCVVLFAVMGRSFLPEFNEKALTISAVILPFRYLSRRSAPQKKLWPSGRPESF